MIFFFICWALLFSAAYASASLAPWVPISKKDLENLLGSISLKDEQVFMECGSGDARVSLAFAKKYPSARIIAYEISLFFYVWSYIKIKKSGLKNIELHFKNVLKADISQVDYFYFFGLQKTLNGIFHEKIERDMKKGSFCVSYLFPFDEKKWGKGSVSRGKYQKIYFYKK